MPVIVDEVVISVEVTNQDSGEAPSTKSSTEDKQEIINECVERILDILNQKNER
jgi:hypothetical protein